MVERIVAATAQVLAEEGYEGASTNRIAAQANVGIGSVYRYFADKDELVAAVIDRVTSQIETEVSEAIIAGIAMPFEVSLRTTIDAIVTSLERNASLLRVLMGDLPRAGGTHGLGATEQRVYQVGRAALVHLLGPVPASELAAITYLAMSTILALSVRIALERPQDLEREDLIDHATRMIFTWLDQYRV
jgi:AcrR family transcriptional regulator